MVKGKKKLVKSSIDNNPGVLLSRKTFVKPVVLGKKDQLLHTFLFEDGKISDEFFVIRGKKKTKIKYRDGGEWLDG